MNRPTGGRSPDVRENARILGNLAKDFDFSQPPRPPLILAPCPAGTTLVPKPKPGCHDTVPLHARSGGDS